MSKNYLKKFSISIFAFSAIAFGVWHNDANASFWDWFKVGGVSQQTAATTATTYKWINNGLVSENEGRNTGVCGAKTFVETSTCDSSKVGNKVYDGTDRGSSYNDTGHAWPIYEGENTSTATKYTYDSSACGLVKRTGGKVNEWECKSSDSATNSSSSSSSSTNTNSSSSQSNSSSSFSYSTNLKVVTDLASNVTSNSATLNGTINPKGENVSYMFYYVKSGQPETQKMTPWKSVASGSSDVSVSANVSGLSSNTAYRFAVVAYSFTSKKFTRIGGVQSFTTSDSSTAGSSSSSSSVQQYTLKVKISGAGKIESNPSGINCSKDNDGNYKETGKKCEASFSQKTSVTLHTETPSSKYEFATWADDCRASQSNPSCNVAMNGDKTVSATFNKKITEGNSVTVSVRKTGEGEGKVISVYSTGENSGKEDGRINCGANCSENFQQICENTSDGRSCSSAYFKAVPEKGSTFGGWGGNCLTFKNEKDQCYVILDGNKTITASFNGGNNDLTVAIASGYGTVKSTDGKIDCSTNSSGGSDCKETYKKNGTVTLKATPNSGYLLSSALGCDEKTNNNDGSYTCKVKITKDRNVNFNFKSSGTSSSNSSSSSSKLSSSSSSYDISASWATNLKAVTDAATNVTSNSATLNGTVNPKGESIGYRFLYVKAGQKETLKNTSWTTVSGSTDTSVSANISGLSSGTNYNFAVQVYSYTSKKFVLITGAKSFTTSGGSSDSSSSSSSSSSGQTTSSTYKLKVTISGNGRIQDNQSKIDCSSNMTCQATYSKGQVFTLKTDETNSEGKDFGTKVDSWSGGGCSGASNACFITMDENKEITVKFVSK